MLARGLPLSSLALMNVWLPCVLDAVAWCTNTDALAFCTTRMLNDGLADIAEESSVKTAHSLLLESNHTPRGLVRIAHPQTPPGVSFSAMNKMACGSAMVAPLFR